VKKRQRGLAPYRFATGRETPTGLFSRKKTKETKKAEGTVVELPADSLVRMSCPTHSVRPPMSRKEKASKLEVRSSKLETRNKFKIQSTKPNLGSLR
jgi:hypothetical protein